MSRLTLDIRSSRSTHSNKYGCDDRITVRAENLENRIVGSLADLIYMKKGLRLLLSEADVAGVQ